MGKQKQPLTKIQKAMRLTAAEAREASAKLQAYAKLLEAGDPDDDGSWCYPAEEAHEEAARDVDLAMRTLKKAQEYLAAAWDE
jgi:hypothetical protein